MTLGSGLAPGPGLARFAAPRPAAAPVAETCELCREVIPADHPHVIDLTGRSLLCACKPCHMLFLGPAQLAGRYRAVPDRYLHDPAARLPAKTWAELGIPVTTAFFFRNSALGAVVAFYPSPGGATEAALAPGAFDQVFAGWPLAALLDSDVEALLVTGAAAQDGLECFLAPIDACYSLVGRLRLSWRGFDGGAEARAEVADFFAALRARSRPVPPAPAGG